MKLSKHFSEREFRCPLSGESRVSESLVTALEELRALIGLPITVLSGYRCPRYNQFIGGAQSSEHVRGQAADITVSGLPLKQLYEAALKVTAFYNGGIGIYPKENMLHVDVRGRTARWGRLAGQYVSLSAALDALKS